MSVVLETGAEMEDLDGGWATREPTVSNAQEQQRATPWSHAAPLKAAIQANWGVEDHEKQQRDHLMV